jgi:hypothetical protein
MIALITVENEKSKKTVSREVHEWNSLEKWQKAREVGKTLRYALSDNLAEFTEEFHISILV